MNSGGVERLGWVLVHFVWQGAAVAGLLAVWLLLARRASASFRYGLACAALGLMAVLPLATFEVLAPGKSGHGVAFPSGARVHALMPSLVAVWAVGVAALGVRFLGALWQVERWRRKNTRWAGLEWQERAEALGRRLRLSRPVTVLLSDRTEVPSTWGVLRPVILVPASLVAKMSMGEIEAILLHELAHIRRHDYLVNLVQKAVETALFYHPAVWWVSSVVRRERELCCDAAVVEAMGEPLPYARALVKLATWQASVPGPSLSAKGGDLKVRIRQLSMAGSAPARSSVWAPGMTGAGMAAAVVFGGTLVGVRSNHPAALVKRVSPAPKVDIELVSAPEVCTDVAPDQTFEAVASVEKVSPKKALPFKASGVVTVAAVRVAAPVSVPAPAQAVKAPVVSPLPAVEDTFTIEVPKAPLVDMKLASIPQVPVNVSISGPGMVNVSFDWQSQKEAVRQALEEARQAQREALDEARQRAQEARDEARQKEQEARDEARQRDQEARELVRQRKQEALERKQESEEREQESVEREQEAQERAQEAAEREQEAAEREQEALENAREQMQEIQERMQESAREFQESLRDLPVDQKVAWIQGHQDQVKRLGEQAAELEKRAAELKRLESGG